MDMSPDVTDLRSKVEQICVEVKGHRDRLEKVTTQQDKATETANKLQVDVNKIDSEIRDIAEMRSKLQETAAEVKEQRGKLEELSTEHGKTAESVVQLQNDVTKIQSEVFVVFFLKFYSYTDVIKVIFTKPKIFSLLRARICSIA